MKRKITGSIRFRFMISLLLLVAGVVVFVILFNSFFLARYYKHRKLQALDAVYRSLEKASGEDVLLSDAFDVELFRASSRDNIDVVLMDPDSRTVKSYSMDSAVMERRMWENLLDQTPDIGDAKESQPPAYSTYRIEMIRQENTQTVQTVEDVRTSARYMEMWGILSGGIFYLMRTPLESIENSALIANRFILLAGGLAAILGLVIAYFLAGSLTRPVRQMQSLSERMRMLDFTAKYPGGGSNELQELGENLNMLSEALESNIRQLKEANAELEEDLRKKDEIEKMRREFISNVTHELKTPIAIIQGYAEGLVDQVASDEESRNLYAGVIADEAARMNQMVQKMLELNHLEFGQTKVERERFDIAACIDGYLENGRLLADKEGIRVRFPHDGPVFVWSDQFLCEQVFSNYFTNAVHHAEGEKLIDISLSRNENCVQVTVFNTGSQIPDEEMDRIWDQFYKIDKSRSRQYGGSGIGLSIVKAAMELLEGGYGAVNEENGVSFYFTLPAADETENQ